MRRLSIYSNKDIAPPLLRIFKAVKNSPEQGILRNAVYIWGANLLPGFLGAAFWWLTSRFYLPAQVGLASAIISAGGLLSIFSRLGLDISLIRFLPGSDKKNHLLNTVFSFNIVISIIISSLFLAIIPKISPKLIDLRQNLVYILGFVLFIVASTLTATLRAVYVGNRAAKYSFMTSLIGNGAKLGFISLGFIIFFRNLGITSIVGAVFGGILISVAVGFKLFLPAIIQEYKYKLSFDWSFISPIIPYSLGNFMADLVMQTPQTILPLLILNTLGETANGHAYVALLMGNMLTGPGLALGRAAFAEGSNRLSQALDILKKSALVGGLFTLFVAALSMVLAPFLLKFFGDSYAEEATELFRWMAAASPIAVITQLFYTRLRINKNVKLLITLGLLNVVISLLVTKIGLPRLGISAAGIGMVIGYLFSIGLIGIILASKKTKGL